MKVACAFFVFFLSGSTISAGASQIERGLMLLSHTHENLKENVTASLNCTSCHLDGGTKANAGPWLGVTKTYPKYNAREGRIITIEDRVNECFERSLNGKKLQPSSAAMRDIISYLSSLSSKPIIHTERKDRRFKTVSTKNGPDFNNGKHLYLKQCVSCHGNDGSGKVGEDGEIIYPPLWGKDAFNIGAGMARLSNAASFIKWNMPLGKAGSLKDQDAIDIAAYIIHQPRPDYKDKDKDWPNGGKPADARY